MQKGLKNRPHFGRRKKTKVINVAAGWRSAVGSASDSRARGPIPGFNTRSGHILFVSPSTDSRRTVVSYWGKYVQEVLVSLFGDLWRFVVSLVKIAEKP